MSLAPATDPWRIEQANRDRADALVAFGFTERQARFLVHVLLHAGVFVERQYAEFAGIAHGQKTTDFLARLVARQYATPIVTGALHRGRLFHVHYKPLWAAIGEPDSRFRKPATLGRLIERVILLDAVLADRDLVWLGPSADKVRFFASEHEEGERLRPDEYPHLCFGEGPTKVTRYFPDKLPIGAKPYGSPHVFLYLVTRSSPADFRAFLIRHTNLLGTLHEWTVRLLFPQHLTKAIPTYRDAARDHLAIAVAPSSLDELRWLFHERRRLVQTPSASPDRRYMDAVKAFCGPRYSALYRAWQAGGDAALLEAASTILPDAVDRERGRLDCVVLSRQYLHLSSLVGVA